MRTDNAHSRLAVASLLTVLAAGACARLDSIGDKDGSAGSSGAGPTGTGGAGASPGTPMTGGRDATVVDVAPVDRPPPCVGLQCQQTACPGGVTTSISGTAYAPNGKLPLYNVMVYVPNAPLEPLPVGVSCDRCGQPTGHPIASAITDEEGKFVIKNAPAGKNIPLVLQVGKWRRQVTIPEVASCSDTALADPNLTRLPANRKEGDLPRTAATTGNCDRLGCLLPKLGVDPAEMGVAGEDKSVIFYQGDTIPLSDYDGPPNKKNASVLWSSVDELSKFDMVLLSCECREAIVNKGMMAYEAMGAYLNKGGRIFGTDFMYVWYKQAVDAGLRGALTVTGGAPAGDSPMTIDTTFPKGKALADWMKFVDPTVVYGQIRSEEVFDNLAAAMPGTSQVWASSTSPRNAKAAHPRIVTINTPASLPADKQCGRAVHIDAHISMLRTSDLFDPTSNPPTLRPFPKNCGTELDKGEIALAFFLFDLAACIQDDTKPVEPPIIP